jgi:ABC-type transport system involved in cytochrome c biogenesis ATPase subunit
MKIKEIQVTGLFGTFDHTIPLTNSDRITIIHSPNGFGKTMILKMIASLASGDMSIFQDIPFTEFRVLLENGMVGTIRRHVDVPNSNKKDNDNAHITLEVRITDSRGKEIEHIDDIFSNDVSPVILDYLDKNVPHPYVRFRNGWRNSSNNKIYTLRHILKQFPNLVKLYNNKIKMDWAKTILGNMEAFFVETKRLQAEIGNSDNISKPRYIHSQDMFFEDVREQGQDNILRVNQYSFDILQKIKTVLADYAKHSQENDRRFPERLVRFLRESVNPFPAKEILKSMNELEFKRKRLISLGFLDSESGLGDLTEEDVLRANEALTIYVGDVQMKLNVFDDLSQRVGKLIDILNERYKYKKISINKDIGFVVQTDDGSFIKLEDLSSGEQHELVVLYELLFRAPKNGLILVDEPEISLHAAWQSRFLPDLMEIVTLTDSYAIVATHSPIIIGNRWDLTKELTGPSMKHQEHFA